MVGIFVATYALTETSRETGKDTCLTGLLGTLLLQDVDISSQGRMPVPELESARMEMEGALARRLKHAGGMN